MTYFFRSIAAILAFVGMFASVAVCQETDRAPSFVEKQVMRLRPTAERKLRALCPSCTLEIREVRVALGDLKIAVFGVAVREDGKPLLEVEELSLNASASEILRRTR